MENGSNGNEKLQIIYRWKALTKENPLKQLFLRMENCTSLALEEKEIGYKTQLSDWKSNQANWRFIGLYVGPTIPLKRLLAQIYFFLYVFHNGVGVLDREQ
jgi:hypothetical protein